MSDEKREPVTYDAAKGMLDVRDGRVHTFRNAGNILVGADWDEAGVLAAIHAHGAELSGAKATAMDHGLCLFDEHGALFLRTKKPEARA